MKIIQIKLKKINNHQIKRIANQKKKVQISKKQHNKKNNLIITILPTMMKMMMKMKNLMKIMIPKPQMVKTT